MVSEQIYNDLKEQLPEMQEALSQGLQYGTELFHAYVNYMIVVSIIGMLLNITLVSVGIYATRKIYKKMSSKDKYWGSDDIGLFVVMTAAIWALPAFISLFGFATDIINLIQALFIPELLLINLF